MLTEGRMVGVGCQGDELNYENPNHQQKVMFTFRVNSVCACADAYVCLDNDPLGKEFNT